MKDSGFPDIGCVPSAWTIMKVKHIFDVICGATPKENPENWDGNIPWIGPSDMPMTGTIEHGKRFISELGYASCGTTLVPQNSIIISTRAPIGKICIAANRLCTNQGCKALVPRNKSINNGFFAYYLRSIIERLEVDGTGTTFKELSTSKLLNEPLIAPPISEQSAIAAYLDTQCAKIDEIIAEAKASIEDYKQWKASIIYEAVTKGLDPNVEMKDSGIEWIGEIPKSVNCSFVGKHFEITLGKMLCNSPDNDQYTLEPYYCAANVHFSGILCDDLKEMWFSPLDKRKYLAQSGDLLVVEGGAGAGGSFVLSEQDKIAYFQNSILRVRPKRDNNVRYLKYLIEALVTQDYINYVCNRATIPHFTKEKLSATPFLVFSGIQQKGIADHLDDVCAKIDKIISQKQSLVFDLESYKKSLIYEVVTGKRRAC